MPTELITEQLRQLPASPGVYLMRDAGGNILYVGKASILRNRVRSYFASPEKLTPKILRMTESVFDIDFFITANEQEALILENNLIKRHHPYFNVRLKDDKSYPFLKISVNEDFPRVYVTRRMEEDGGRYFGPFASSRSVRHTLKALQSLFPSRSCTRGITGKDSRACLDYFIHLCPAPCTGAISKRDYNETIKQVILFLEGKQEKVVRSLKADMERASEGLNFEKAAQIRDQLQAIEQVVEGQKIAARVKGEQDAIAFVTERDNAFVQVFFIRHGKLIGRESFILQGVAAEEPMEIMTGFIKQFYSAAPHIPPLLLLQHQVADKEVITEWLKSRRGGSVVIETPVKGSKKQLIDIVAENAAQSLQQMKIRQEAGATSTAEALEEIARELDLPNPPQRMECYDISNIQGRLAVGSMVVFEAGKPKPSLYRRFRIKTVEGANDYAMLQEVLRRRFKRASMVADGSNGGWAVLPDLVVIDGGKGQLSAAMEAMTEVGADSVRLSSLAKENEEIYLPGSAEPVRLPRSSAGLQLFQRLRDEAHRFAIGYHRKIRGKEGLKSALDSVPGIGPARKRALLKKFGTVRGIREAALVELEAVEGMNKSAARKLKELL